MNAYDSYNATWVIEAVDPNYRLEKQGEPVLSSDSILLRHCQTQHFLASDLNNYKTPFGLEYEVMTHSFHALNKTQNLSLEGKGNITVDTPTKF